MWLQEVYQRLVNQPRSGRNPRRGRLTLEALEERSLLSTTVWTGNNILVDSNWSDPANWSNGVPQKNDIAEFTSASVLTQLSTVDTPFTIGGLLFTAGASGATIDVNAPLVLTGSSSLAGGTLNINGPVGGAVTNTGTMALDTDPNGSGTALYGNGTFTNDGAIVVEGSYDLDVGGYNNGQGLSVKLDNTSTGLIDFQSDCGFTSGNGYVANAGTIEKTGGTGTSNFFVSVQNTGTIDAESGTIQLIGIYSSDAVIPSGPVDTNGTFKTAAGAVIILQEAGGARFVEDGTFTAIGSGTILLDSGGLDTGPRGPPSMSPTP